MAKFNKGDKIKHINTGESGLVLEVYPPRRGRQMYKVRYEGRDTDTDEMSTNIIADVDLTDPFERVTQNMYEYYSEYLKINTTVKIQSSNNSTISSLKASRTLFRPYQFKPLLKFLNSDNKRVLIADEVGLGKTIEAGHIMLELKARGELHNALVVCPMSLRAKWVTELNEKFGLNFIDVKDTKELLNEMQYHNGNVRAAINYDKISDKSKILDFIEEKGMKFSIIICDESHKLKNSATHRYKGAERLLLYSDCVVLMSATPIMLGQEDLYNQLHLLDPEMFDNVEIFTNNMRLNAPFVRALSQLNSGVKLREIKNKLENAEVTTVYTINDDYRTETFRVGTYFKDYPIYREIIDNLSSGSDTPAIRARLQYDLSEMSPMNTIFSRTRKREVTRDWSQAERNPHTQHISMTADEAFSYETAIDNYEFEHSVEDEWGNRKSGGFGLVTYKRQLASSVWACLSDNETLDEGYDVFSDKQDAKFNELLRTVKTVFAHDNNKIIVFAIFKKTLKYLKIRLQKAGYKCVLIYGDTSIDKQKVLDSFQKDDSIQILLTSEVGSEGLDMQFCNSLVNYDLPWNPMVVEQRIGRIDRFGQESPKVNIYNIVVRESILEDIYSRLLTRIGVFKESIGDLEAILDAEIVQDGSHITIQEALHNIENEFYSDKLTAEEVERKEKEIARAIENEKLNLQKIEEGLTNTLTNDSYFQEQIKKIENNNAYVTSNELYQLIIQLIKERITTCELLETEDPDIYKFVIAKSDPHILRRFLEQYQPIDMESKKQFRDFIDHYSDKLELQFTFNQERAFRDKALIFINIYHPIIKAAINYFKDQKKKTQCTFFFELPAKGLSNGLGIGKYMLAIYKITTSRMLFGDKPVKTDILYPVLFDILNDCIVEDHELAENFMGKAQVDGRYAPMDEACRLDSEMIEDLRYDMKEYIDRYVNSYWTDMQNRIDNSKKMRYQQTTQYYEQRIKNYKYSIRNQEDLLEYAIDRDDIDMQRKAEGAIRLLNANLRDLIAKRDVDLEKINRDAQLKVTEEILSLNLVNVV